MRGISELDYMVLNRGTRVPHEYMNDVDFYFKNSNKINVYNFPGLKNAKIQAFLYF